VIVRSRAHVKCGVMLVQGTGLRHHRRLFWLQSSRNFEAPQNQNLRRPLNLERLLRYLGRACLAVV
jgi:hypothetical protein